MSFRNYLASSRNEVARYNANGGTPRVSRAVGTATFNAGGVSPMVHRAGGMGVGTFNAGGQADYSNVAPLFGIQVQNTTTNALTNKEWVNNSMKEVIHHPLFNLGYFTPEGAAIGAMQSAIKLGPDLYEGNYKGAAMDALMALPIGIPAAKTLG